MIVEIEAKIGIAVYEKAGSHSELPVFAANVIEDCCEQVGVARDIHIDKNGIIKATITIREEFKDGVFCIINNIRGVHYVHYADYPYFVAVFHPNFSE